MMKEEIRLPNHETQEALEAVGTNTLGERAWGTVREDYSPMATPGNTSRTTTPVHVFPLERRRFAGICDRHQLICFSVALWNEHDPI